VRIREGEGDYLVSADVPSALGKAFEITSVKPRYLPRFRGKTPPSNEESTSYLYSPKLGLMVREGLEKGKFLMLMNLVRGGNFIKIPEQLFSKKMLREAYALPFMKEILSPYSISLHFGEITQPDLVIKTRFGVKLFSVKDASVLTLSSHPDYDYLLEKEIEMRKKYARLSLVNELTEHGRIAGTFYYKEPLLPGVFPLLTENGGLDDRNVLYLFGELAKLYGTDMKAVESREYAKALVNETGPELGETEAGFLETRFLKGKPRTGEIYISTVHGDLVPSNVMGKGGKIKLIDWSHAGCNSITHDLYTLLTNVACTKGTSFDLRDLVLAASGGSKTPLGGLLAEVQTVLCDKLGLGHLDMQDYLLIYSLERIRLDSSMRRNPKRSAETCEEVIKAMEGQP
jgi:hypothetical protein